MPASPRVPQIIGNFKFPFLGNADVGPIVARAGGGQANATQLGAQMNRVDTVASAADSVKLPKIVPNPGQLSPTGVSVLGFIVVTNNTATAMQLFGGLLDTINAVASATGVSVAAGKTVILVAVSYTKATNVGTWVMVP